MNNPTTTQRKPELTSLTLWIMTIGSGMVVANNYYNQPLLGKIADTFQVTEAKAGSISVQLLAVCSVHSY